MDEVLSILIAVTALILGLLVIGWASGDYQSRPGGTGGPGGQGDQQAS